LGLWLKKTHPFCLYLYEISVGTANFLKISSPMSKEKTVKKAEKKKPEKNLKEKRADKKAKKDSKKRDG
jgi:hypothetical protein